MKSLFLESEIENIKRSRGLTPSILLYEIRRFPHIRDYTYVIMGKNGPTGKTWLWSALIDNGFKAIELSEYIYHLVEYTDSDNHFIVDDFHKSITIILNKPLT